MLTLIKLLRALNSAQAEYQIALALAFGFLSGVLPFFSLINLFILFIVFTVNIPIGLYFIFATLFSLVGSIFDPLLHTLGLNLLNNPTLTILWTNLYNSPLALWLNFNHTITLGGLFVGIITFIPLFFAGKFFIKKYRDVFHNLFKNIRFLSFFDPYNKSHEKENAGFIRWWGSGVFLTFVSILVIFVLLAMDPLIKFTLESVISKDNTKLQIDSLDTSIINTNIKLTNVTISRDNKINTIEKVSLNLNTNNLLRKKIDIESFILSNISLDKAFQSSRILKTELKANNTQTSTVQKSSPNIHLPNIDSLLEKENLSSLNRAKEIKKRFEVIQAKWKKISQEKIPINQISDLQKEFQQDKQIIKNDLQKIKTLPKEDYNYLINKYKLNQDGAMNFISTYIDKDITKYLDKVLKIYKELEPHLQGEDDPEIIRKKGQWIEFNETNPYPNFAIQKLEANIIDPSIKEFQIIASYVYDVQFNVAMKDMEQKQIFMDDTFVLNNNNLDINIILTIKNLKKLELQSNIIFKKTNPLYKGQKFISTTLQNIHNFKIDIGATAQIDKKENLKLSISSDLDKKVRKAFKNKMKQYKETYKKELKQKLQAKLSKELGGVSINSLNEYKDIFKQKAKQKLEDKLKHKLKNLF